MDYVFQEKEIAPDSSFIYTKAFFRHHETIHTSSTVHFTHHHSKVSCSRLLFVYVVAHTLTDAIAHSHSILHPSMFMRIMPPSAILAILLSPLLTPFLVTSPLLSIYFHLHWRGQHELVWGQHRVRFTLQPVGLSVLELSPRSHVQAKAVDGGVEFQRTDKSTSEKSSEITR